MVRWKLMIVVAWSLTLGALSGLAMLPGGLGRLFKGPDAGTPVARALVGGPFTLTAHDGKRVSDRDFRGKFMLVYFGFTYCPDVCPAGLQVISAALQQLGPKGEIFAPLFISVDPERDTPADLARYVQSFHPRLVGLTGTAEEIGAVAKAYRVYYKKVKDEKSTIGYTIDHTSLIYIMDPSGNYVTHFTHATPLDQMVDRLRKFL